MSTQPFTAARFRAFDANGNPLSGGLLYTYAAGTTTPQATYTDRSGGAANTNPVVLDANGEADVWLTAGVDYQFTLLSSTGSLQWTVDNYPSPVESSASTDVAATEPGGRLTLISATPVTTADVGGATNILYVPYRHDKVPLYDGTTWALHSIGSAGLSQRTTDNTKSPAAVTTNSNYDLFVWNDAGTIRLSRGPAWTSDTARGAGVGTTELVQVNGRYVNANVITNGPGAQLGLYVGTIRTDGSSQVNDTATKRYVWNNHHRVARTMRRLESTSTWAGVGATTVRQANGSTANQLDFVRGLDEERVRCEVLAMIVIGGTGGWGNVGIGLDATAAFSPSDLSGPVNANASSLTLVARAVWMGFPGLGAHSLKWLEEADTTHTWVGVASGTGQAGQSGITADVMA